MSPLAMLAVVQAAWLADARRLMLVNVLLVLVIVGAASAIVLALVRRSMRQRVEAARLAAMGTATARILHQVKNPLQTILLHAEMLNDTDLVADEVARREVSQAIMGEATRMTDLLGELSAYASGVGRRLDTAPLRLDTLVRDAARQAEREARREGIHVEVGALTGVTVEADAYFLRQALENVIRNAREALRERADQSDGRVWIALRRRGTEVMIEVRDNGPGMSAEQVRTACEPFITTKGKGMGLGLAICREILEGHGGRVELRSRPGAGTTVWLVLPVVGTTSRTLQPA